MYQEVIMLSVITVCRNSEKTIQKTIISILNQTNTDIEHIFIDGNSKDNTVSIIQSYQDEYKKNGIKLVIVSEADAGIYDAMNKGIKLSTGSIIGILNSDDWYELHTSALVQKSLENGLDTDILMGATYIWNGEQQIIKKVKRTLWVTSRSFNHPAMFVKKKCYEEIGDYNISMIYADFDWYLRAIRSGKRVSCTDEILSDFMVGGISNQKSLDKVIYRVKDRYQAYRNNGYPRLYIGECILQEFAKYCLIHPIRR